MNLAEPDVLRFLSKSRERIAAAACVPVLIASPLRSGAQELPENFLSFFDRYCMECHDPDTAKGDFHIDLLGSIETVEDAEYWKLTLDNLHLGDMPPEKETQPTLAELEEMTSWIENGLERAATKLAGHTGEVVLRRLNRTEFENTIEDLFDVRGDYAEAFPEDTEEEGFDNIGAALMMSAEQLDAYLEAIDFVLDRAIVRGERPEPKSVSFTLHDLNRENWERTAEMTERNRSKYDGLTDSEKERTRLLERLYKENPYYAYRYPAVVNGELVQPTPEMGPETEAAIPVNGAFGSRPSTKDYFRVREPGTYRFRLTAAAYGNEGESVQLQIAAGSFQQGVIPRIVAVLALPDAEVRDYEFLVDLEPGNSIQMEMLNGQRAAGGPDRDLLAVDGHMAVIREISLEGPIVEEWPPKGHRLLLGERTMDSLKEEDVPVLVAELAPKLFRRPVSESVVQDFLGYYETTRESTDRADAYRRTVMAMMASPFFLYHVEPGANPDAFAVANRLSYFLWRSAPDAELMNLASSGELLDPAVRRAQAERMLADEREERFLRDFTGQWLWVDQVGEMKPDASLYPEYDEHLERSMKEETIAFVREMLRTDEPLLALLDSDWAMLDERMARHYGIPGVSGNEFQRVSLNPKETVRGGLLTQASILTVTSNGTTTSPVVRGVFVLDQLLGTPAPPPPPDVPPIEPDIRGASTIQEQLQKHREIAQCSSCHEKIDPYGIALENFDVIGGWREAYRALELTANPNRPNLVDGKPVGTADRLPRHGAFSDFESYRELLKKDERLVYANLAHKLATYALGRKMDFADEGALKTIAAGTKRSGGGFRTMVFELVANDLFQRP